MIKITIIITFIVITLTVSPDMTIISGHQRYKACKDLGIDLVPVIIKEDLTNENDKLRKLLAANFGRLKNDEIKQRKVAVKYVELCGLKNGEKLCDNRTALTMDEIAEQLGTSKRTLQEMLEIERKLTPEVKELINAGLITKTTASKIWTKLSPAEQTQLLEELGKDKIAEMTQKQTEEYLQQKKEAEIKALQLEKDKQELQNKLTVAENNK